MKKIFVFILLIGSWCANAQSQEDSLFVREVYDFELTRGMAYEWLRDLSNNIGGRLSGSPEAQKAVEWSKAVLDSLGLDTVWLQPVMVPHWVRGEKENCVALNNGRRIPLTICSLGGSEGTGGNAIRAQVIEVYHFDELEELGAENIKGKIIFFNRPMEPRLINTFSAYGGCVDQRWAGALEASKYGAVGVLVRSMSHKIDDHAHTGSMSYEGATERIPAAALSTLAAERLDSLLRINPELEIELEMDCKNLPDEPSFNVIGQIVGSEYPDEIILVGGHLDAWDNGDGAHDDGAGVVHSMEVLYVLKQLGYKPKRTLRVVLFMNEENGLRGAKEYAKKTKENNWYHLAAIESDRGGFTPRGFAIEGSEEMIQFIAQYRTLLEPYGLHDFQAGGSGADVHPLKREDNILLGYLPDSQRYFDHHHAPSDTFEAVNKRELELGAAAITSMVYLLDKYGIPIHPVN